MLKKFFMSAFEVEGNEGLPNFEDREFTELFCTLDVTNDTLFKAIDNVKASSSVIDAHAKSIIQ